MFKKVKKEINRNEIASIPAIAVTNLNLQFRCSGFLRMVTVKRARAKVAANPSVKKDKELSKVCFT